MLSLLDIPSVDRVAIAARLAADPRLARTLAELQVASQQALSAYGEGEREEVLERVRTLQTRACVLARPAGAWKEPPDRGIHLLGVRSFSGTIGVHYGVEDGRPIVLKASREMDGEIEAARLAARLGLTTPAIRRIPIAELARIPDLPSGTALATHLLLEERVEGFDLRNAPLVGWRPDPEDRTIFEGLGEIAAFDLLVGNWDRFVSANTGNLMVAEGRLVLVDTEASFTARPSEVHSRVARAIDDPELPGLLSSEVASFLEKACGFAFEDRHHRWVNAGAAAFVDRFIPVAEGEPEDSPAGKALAAWREASGEWEAVRG
ncbi:MAG: hypothetical protein HY720_13680 [Planctomycetes bacterium]|nr:hypothetical protein [Planctomycetota bacterium]